MTFFVLLSWQEVVIQLPHDLCGFYLLHVIKLLSWSFIHLINNSALEVGHRDPFFIVGEHKHAHMTTQKRTQTHNNQHRRSWQPPFETAPMSVFCMSAQRHSMQEHALHIDLTQKTKNIHFIKKTYDFFCALNVMLLL